MRWHWPNARLCPPKQTGCSVTRTSSCRLLTRAFVMTGPQPRGPPSSLLIVWIRCLFLKVSTSSSISVSISLTAGTANPPLSVSLFLFPNCRFWVVNCKWRFYRLFSVMLFGSLMLTLFTHCSFSTMLSLFLSGCRSGCHGKKSALLLLLTWLDSHSDLLSLNKGLWVRM